MKFANYKWIKWDEKSLKNPTESWEFSICQIWINETKITVNKS